MMLRDPSLKAKLRSISRSMSGTEGGPSMETAMSPIEDRVALLMYLIKLLNKLLQSEHSKSDNPFDL